MKIFINLLLVSFLISCSNIKNLSGNQYIYKSSNRELILSFSNDSLCTIKNIFHCSAIENEVKEITINTIYKQKNNTIILKNINCRTENCIFLDFLEIPTYENSDCAFLNIENRENKILFDGRIIQSDFNKNGLIPNIDIDTMYIVKSKIYFTKKSKTGNVGYVFK